MNTRRLCLVLILSLVLGSLALSGCAARRVAPLSGEEIRLSPQGEVAFDYLTYQNLIYRMHRLSRSTPLTPEDIEQIYALQAGAAEALGRVIAVAPSPELYSEKASLYWNAQQIGEARAILKQGLELYPGDRTLSLFLANSYLVEMRMEDAAMTLKDYLARTPDDMEVRHRLAQILVDAGMAAEALDQINRIPEDQRDVEVLYTMALAQAKVGQTRQATATLEHVLEVAPDFLEALVELAYLYELDRDYDAAERAYAKLLDMGDPQGEVRLRMINLNLKLNNPARALRLTSEGPRGPAFLLEATVLFIEQGFPAEAGQTLDMLSEADASTSEVAFYRAVIAYEHLDDPEAALRYLSMVPPTDRNAPAALQFRARILYAEGRRDEALALVMEGRQRYPQDSRFYLLESELFLQDDRFDEALQVLSEAMERWPADMELLYQWGVANELAGNRQAAMEAMELVIESDPEHADALNFLGYTLADEGQELERALVLIRTALSLEPDSGYIIDSLAWVYYRMGRVNEAWLEIRRAVDEVDDDAIVWEHYGDIAQAAGKPDEARRGYTRALELEPENPQELRDKLEAL